MTHRRASLATAERAMHEVTEAMRPDEPPKALPPGTKKRALLVSKDINGVGDTFRFIVTTIQHYPALMAIGETYLAMPRPDDNFVPDFRTNNFDARLWELYLLAAFREHLVTQDQPSPDFLIERAGHQCYVEAVTANPNEPRAPGFSPPARPPADNAERVVGPPAVRFAKTLRSKLQRQYERYPHVRGKAFALAIADFHAPSSMTWSCEALPSYLYGFHPQVVE